MPTENTPRELLEKFLQSSRYAQHLADEKAREQGQHLPQFDPSDQTSPLVVFQSFAADHVAVADSAAALAKCKGQFGDQRPYIFVNNQGRHWDITIHRKDQTPQNISISGYTNACGAYSFAHILTLPEFQTQLNALNPTIQTKLQNLKQVTEYVSALDTRSWNGTGTNPKFAILKFLCSNSRDANTFLTIDAIEIASNAPNFLVSIGMIDTTGAYNPTGAFATNLALGLPTPAELRGIVATQIVKTNDDAGQPNVAGADVNNENNEITIDSLFKALEGAGIKRTEKSTLTIENDNPLEIKMKSLLGTRLGNAQQQKEWYAAEQNAIATWLLTNGGNNDEFLRLLELTQQASEAETQKIVEAIKASSAAQPLNINSFADKISEDAFNILLNDTDDTKRAKSALWDAAVLLNNFEIPETVNNAQREEILKKLNPVANAINDLTGSTVAVLKTGDGSINSDKLNQYKEDLAAAATANANAATAKNIQALNSAKRKLDTDNVAKKTARLEAIFNALDKNDNLKLNDFAAVLRACDVTAAELQGKTPATKGVGGASAGGGAGVGGGKAGGGGGTPAAATATKAKADKPETDEEAKAEAAKADADKAEAGGGDTPAPSPAPTPTQSKPVPAQEISKITKEVQEFANHNLDETRVAVKFIGNSKDANESRGALIVQKQSTGKTRSQSLAFIDKAVEGDFVGFSADSGFDTAPKAALKYQKGGGDMPAVPIITNKNSYAVNASRENVGMTVRANVNMSSGGDNLVSFSLFVKKSSELGEVRVKLLFKQGETPQYYFLDGKNNGIDEANLTADAKTEFAECREIFGGFDLKINQTNQTKQADGSMKEETKELKVGDLFEQEIPAPMPSPAKPVALPLADEASKQLRL